MELLVFFIVFFFGHFISYGGWNDEILQLNARVRLLQWYFSFAYFKLITTNNKHTS